MLMTLQPGGDRRRCLGAGLFRKRPNKGLTPLLRSRPRARRGAHSGL